MATEIKEKSKVIEGKPSENVESNVEETYTDEQGRKVIKIKQGATKAKPKDENITEIEHEAIGYGYTSAEALRGAPNCGPQRCPGL